VDNERTDVMVGVTMGRPKKAAKRVAGPRTVGVRASAEWADWIERAARHCRTDIAKLVDAAVADYVREKGFTEPPPERVP
jgi:hypothetical protein